MTASAPKLTPSMDDAPQDQPCFPPPALSLPSHGLVERTRLVTEAKSANTGLSRRSPGAPTALNVTLVAFYGEKPPGLRALIRDVQTVLQEQLGAAFVPYDMRQVHATIIGLEGLLAPDGAIVNANYARLRGQHVPAVPKEALQLVRETPLLPMTVRLGGYRSNTVYPFRSRGEHLYARSFSFQGESAIMVGWPAECGGRLGAIDELRRGFGQVGALHKYHGSPGDVDNDLFLVLGRVHHDATDRNTLRTVEGRAREFMAASRPFDVVLDRAALQLVQYADPSLPLGTSVAVPVDLDADLFAELYDMT